MEFSVNERINAFPLSNELKLEKNSIVVELEPITMKILEYLASKKGDVCTKQELIEKVWHGNQEVGKPALRKNIYKLRAALSQMGEDGLIRTIPKKGYLLNGADSSSKNQFFWQPRFYYIIGAIIIFLITIKIIFPGIVHRLMH